MNNPLRQLGNIPVTTSVLESLFPHIRGGSQKLRLLERDKQIIRLKKGLYVCNPEITGKILSTELIANHLYAPSYVSMSSALRYYGLIPEEVYTKQSMTLKYAKNFDTPFGRFEYIITHIDMVYILALIADIYHIVTPIQVFGIIELPPDMPGFPTFF